MSGQRSSKMAVCVAVISKENYPLYIQTIPTEDDLKFHYTVHTSLDVVEEKINNVGKTTNDLRELYLGLLYPTEDYKVYGYVTNTKIKFVVVVESSNTALRDNEIRTMFRKLHNANLLCFPCRCSGSCTTRTRTWFATPSTPPGTGSHPGCLRR
ncbi:trafficking protein particle complex subunit 2-like protein isoform X1 [Branchiostoma lanceolatum]|uniref:trafficking protein particle complex subunit 2-like protein isoform X1 n=1 Tax=Branchiostoma lanceolatum TaxID=7740 RepID=UPI003455E9E9